MKFSRFFALCQNLNLIFCFGISLFSAGARAQENASVVVYVDRGGDTISRHIYGHFSEHLGRCIYDGLYVGEKSTIPNTNGMRNDVAEALRKIKIPNLRWPGGCFADTYHWKDGVGPKDQRAKIVNTWWGGSTEDNSFGTHEFLELCRQLKTEPYITGNVGSGTPQEMQQWVEYLNFDGVSPMSDWRKKNGQDSAWKIKYFGLGNEPWGCGGNMTPEHYADLFRQYATFVNNYNGKAVYKIAGGGNSDNYHWTETLMKNIPLNLLDGLGLHHYSVNWSNKSSATEFTDAQYVETMQKTILLEALVSKHAAIMDKYDPKKKVGLIIDEWGGWYDEESTGGVLYQQNTMRDAVLAGIALNIFNNHADRVRMANIAQTVNVLQAVILTKGDQMILTPTYHVFDLYSVHQDARLLPTDVRTDSFVFEKTSLPAVSCSASRDRRGATHVTLTNLDLRHSKKITVDLRGMTVQSVSGRILTAPNIRAHNTFEVPQTVKPAVFTGFSKKNNGLTVELPAASVVALEML